MPHTGRGTVATSEMSVGGGIPGEGPPKKRCQLPIQGQPGCGPGDSFVSYAGPGPMPTGSEWLAVRMAECAVKEGGQPGWRDAGAVEWLLRSSSHRHRSSLGYDRWWYPSPPDTFMVLSSGSPPPPWYFPFSKDRAWCALRRTWPPSPSSGMF